MVMKSSSLPGIITPVLAIGCLTAAYIAAGYWVILPAVAAMVIFWIAIRKTQSFWSASSLLAVYVVLAIAGILLKAPVVLIVPGCIAALAAWDLMDLKASTAGAAPAGGSRVLAQRRLQALGTASGVSLLLATASLVFRIHLPFGVLVLLALLVVGCLTYIVQRFGNANAKPG